MCLNQEIYLLGVEMHITFGAFRFMINIKGVFFAVVCFLFIFIKGFDNSTSENGTGT